MTRNEVKRRAADLGLTVTTWSPGDGVTRYRIHPGTARADYFADHYHTTELGASNAWRWLDGYAVGYFAAQNAWRDQSPERP